MLSNFDDVPDEAVIWVMFASRVLTTREQHEVSAILDVWIEDWSTAFPECPITLSRLLFDGRVFAWAVDCQPRELAGKGPPHLSGSDLDPMYRSLDAYSTDRSPPFDVAPNMALIVNDDFVTSGPQWLRLAREGIVTADTPLIRSCSAAQWRAGWLVHRLGDEDPEFVERILGSPRDSAAT